MAPTVSVMTDTLRGRSALVTGSTAGLGLAIARALAEQGCRVTLHGLLPAAEGEAIAAALPTSGRYHRADLTRPEEIAPLVAGCAPDILVNNAVTRHFGAIEAMDPAGWDMDLAVNLSAAFHAIRLALPGMKARGWGRIVNIASAHGLVASPFKVAYVAAKHAVVGMTKVVAIEVAKTQITCNAICPGFVRTPLAEKQVHDLAQKNNVSDKVALEEMLLVHQPSKRWVEVDDVAQMALYLCGPGSGSVNGAALSIDGGWLAA
jgi:3-hydroxybutyrate dehydrogenase